MYQEFRPHTGHYQKGGLFPNRRFMRKPYLSAPPPAGPEVPSYPPHSPSVSPVSSCPWLSSVEEPGYEA
jgi:hypothetical protein